MKRNSNGQASGILRDKTMHEKFVYIRNDNKQNYTVDCNYWFKSLNRPILIQKKSKFFSKTNEIKCLKRLWVPVYLQSNVTSLHGSQVG